MSNCSGKAGCGAVLALALWLPATAAAGPRRLEENIAWGTLDEDNIVWGTSANKVSVLGSLGGGAL